VTDFAESIRLAAPPYLNLRRYSPLQARYEVTDPSGSRSFKAPIQGKQNNQTGKAVLNGVTTKGCMIGSHVHVTFQVIAPCPQFGTGDVCFQGTIRIQRG
jgi:hypothetical protein